MSNTTKRFLMAAAGAAGGATYVDDVFSTYVYKGTGATKTITNGIDLSGEGGMVWIKRRDSSAEHNVYDTERGAPKFLVPNANDNEDTSATRLNQFNNNGFRVGGNTVVNGSGSDYSSWSFRKAPGFCDVVKFTSTGAANQRIPHSLGCEPGMIICKSLTGTSYWVVYHKEIPNMNPSDPWSKSLLLDENYGASTLASDTWGTGPTSTDFGFKAGGFAATGVEWVAYVFAGGESTAATARSVKFNGSNAKLSLAASDDFHLTGDFTIEGWFYPTEYSNEHFWGIGSYLSSLGVLFYIYSNKLYIQEWNSGNRQDRMLMDPAPPQHQWSHIAIVRSGSTMNAYVNGTSVKTWTRSEDYGSSSNKTFTIGASPHGYGAVNISNLRVVKGTAVYTSSFKPPTKPLTNITNTKLLCCNNSSVTGSTVTPGTITSVGATASTDNPFDDPEGFKFGKEEDQNIIKTGSYEGNGSNDGPEIYLGWEPSFIILKCSSHGGENWEMYDSMRGLANTSSGTIFLKPNEPDNEATATIIELTPTGFKLKDSSGSRNNNGKTYIYIAIRRPDGLVGKPAQVGTDVFNIVNGDTDGVDPFFKNIGFPVDLGLFKRKTDSSHNWGTSPRLTQGKYLSANQTRSENSNVHQVFDYMSAWNSGTDTQGGYFTYAWKRGQGFDVVTYTGTGTTHDIPHSLNKTVEMFWLKSRDTSANWMVYHKGLNGGINPEQYFIRLNLTNKEVQASSFGDTAPTSTHFTVGASSNAINTNGDDCIAFLFSSIDGISKVGSYDGTGVVGLTETTGFTPRFLIIKNMTWDHGDWFVYDTLRGWASGTNGEVLQLNTSAAQSNSGTHKTSPTSTGFSVDSTDTAVNASGQKYIYYAHA